MSDSENCDIIRPLHLCNDCSNLPKSASPLDDVFPEDILIRIFDYLANDSNSLENVCQTCPRWATIVDRHVGRVCVTGYGKELIVNTNCYIDRLAIKELFWSTIGSENEEDAEEESKDCNNNQSVDGVSSCKTNEESYPEVPNPEYVRKIAFIGNLGQHVQKMMTRLVSPCKNLTGLFLHFSVFTNLYDEDEPNWRAYNLVPTLKELVIDCSESGSDSDHPFNYKRALCCVYTFLSRETFPLLEKFIYAIPHIPKLEGQMVYALSGFLGRHADTLKRFSFNQKYQVDDDDYDESDKKARKGNSKKAKESGCGDCEKEEDIYSEFPPSEINYLGLKQLGVNMHELKKLDLEELHLIFATPQESSALWKNFVTLQTNFRKLVFAGDKIPCPTMTMKMNSETLVNIRLDVRDVVDLTCFQNCSNLKFLTLRGKAENYYSSEEEDDVEDDADTKTSKRLWALPVQLKKARCLPHSLETIEIINLRTDMDDAAVMCCVLPNVRDVTFINLGWEATLGLCVIHLILIWDQHRLEHFYIKSSLNMESFADLDEDPRYLMNLFSCILHANPSTSGALFTLEVWKDRYGYYTLNKTDGIQTADQDDIDVFHIPDKCQLLLSEDEEEDDEDEEVEEECDEEGMEEEECNEEDEDSAEYETESDSQQSSNEGEGAPDDSECGCGNEEK